MVSSLVPHELRSFALTACSKFCSELPLIKCMCTTATASSDASSSISLEESPSEQLQLIANEPPYNDALTTHQVFPSALRHYPNSCVATESSKAALLIATAK